VAREFQITVHDLPRSPALEERIRRKVTGLERVFGRLTACRVTLQAPHHHQRHGAHYGVRLEIAVPGAEIVINRDHANDSYIALRDAFQAARRQLNEYFQRRRGSDKSRRTRHDAAPAE